MGNGSMTRSLLIVAMITAAPAVAGTNLVGTGGFEDAPLGVGRQYTGSLLPGITTDQAIYRYADVSNKIASTVNTTSYNGGGDGSDDRRLTASVAGVSPAGGNFFGVDGYPHGGSPLSQTISGLTAGLKCTGSFDWAAYQLQNCNGATTNQFIVSLGSETHSTPVVDVAIQGVDGCYKAKFTFTARGPSEVLKFIANGTPAGTPLFALLDGVSLVAGVPKPATSALLLDGFGRVRGAARRRRTSFAA